MTQIEHEMHTLAGDTLDLMHHIRTYQQICEAEDFVLFFKAMYSDVPGYKTEEGMMRHVLNTRRRIVRLNERPAPFDYRYNLEG